MVQIIGGGLAQAFDFAGITDRMGAPSFAFFAKGGTRKCLRMLYVSLDNADKVIEGGPGP